MPRKKGNSGKPDVHKDLKGFEIGINTFGQMESAISLDVLNSFLDKNVDDKKLRDKDDLIKQEQTAEDPKSADSSNQRTRNSNDLLPINNKQKSTPKVNHKTKSKPSKPKKNNDE